MGLHRRTFGFWDGVFWKGDSSRYQSQQSEEMEAASFGSFGDAACHGPVIGNWHKVRVKAKGIWLKGWDVLAPFTLILGALDVI